MSVRFILYPQTYDGLDKFQQKIIQNFEDALALRVMLPSDEYLTGVVREPGAFGDGASSYVYKGKWKEKQVIVKKLRYMTPPVFLIPSDYTLPDSE